MRHVRSCFVDRPPSGSGTSAERAQLRDKSPGDTATELAWPDHGTVQWPRASTVPPMTMSPPTITRKIVPPTLFPIGL
jgi:hypothetical protein